MDHDCGMRIHLAEEGEPTPARLLSIGRRQGNSKPSARSISNATCSSRRATIAAKTRRR